MVYQLGPLKTGPDILRADRDGVPTEVQHPSVDLLDATCSLIPARLRCTWALPGTDETITRTHLMTTGVDAMALAALLGSIALGVASHLVRRPHRQGA